MRTAIYPGSFDPITNGHMSILKSGLTVFDRVIVGVLHNPSKNALFSVEERIEMIGESISEITDEPERVGGLLLRREKNSRSPSLRRDREYPESWSEIPVEG